VAILPTGDELVLPGEPLGPDQIVSSNSLALGAMVASAGGTPIQLGIAADAPESLRSLGDAAAKADLLITIGGASVGDHDLVRDILGAAGDNLDFWKIAMRPGKPLMFGRFAGCPMIGLPGNPVSAIICTMLFVIPAIERLQSLTPTLPMEYATAGAALRPNDDREDYQRAILRSDGSGKVIAYPALQQDSSMMRTLAGADAVLVRRPHDGAISIGDTVRVMRFPGGTLPI
jgi:molybdopterin molybdotransferase